jgi:glycosyltransferase involved in cell wall biosynthesis
MQPLVSILIPAFNAQEWIAETLRSAVTQSWSRKEIIVVDDGSTDQTVAIASKFESDIVRVVRQENQGAAAARNTALSLSTGDFIQWLDADDLLSPDKIERQLVVADWLQNKRMLLSCPWGRFLYRSERASFVQTPLWCDLSPTEWLIRKMGQNLHMQPATWLVSRELTEAAGLWNTTLLSDDDGEYFCRVLLASDGVKFVPEAKIYYRATPNSLSYIGQSDRKMEALWRSIRLHVVYLRSLESSDRTRDACVRYLQTWLIYCYPERPDLAEHIKNLAKEIGGQLQAPKLPWKYSWIESIFGWSVAKRAQLILPKTKLSLLRAWDRTLYQLARG